MFRRGFKTWCEGTAEQVRRRVGLDTADPLPPETLAPILNAQIWSLDELTALDGEVRTRLTTEHSETWSALTIPAATTNIILYNPVHSAARRASDLMHELAHLLLKHEPGHMFIGVNGLALRTHDREQEDEARWLSGCLLLPRESLFKALRSGWSDADVCAIYGVSQNMVTFRRQTSGVEQQYYGRRRRATRS
jgi:Zn-dependent peptidase ImmA (M78 family)